MGGYDSDFTDDIYERYMCTGEGAEFFEDDMGNDGVEGLKPMYEGGECQGFGEFLNDFNHTLDERIKEMEQQLAVLKKAHNKDTAKR